MGLCVCPEVRFKGIALLYGVSTTGNFSKPLMTGRCWLHLSSSNCLQGTLCWTGSPVAMGNEQGWDLCQGHRRAKLFLTAPQTHLNPGIFPHQDK